MLPNDIHLVIIYLQATSSYNFDKYWEYLVSKDKKLKIQKLNNKFKK